MIRRGSDTAAGRAPRGVLATVGDHLLTLLAAAGGLCIALVIAGWVFDVSLIMFRTGSMSPTITAGSLAVVREIPATEMAVGEVVTVDRGDGALPVTHRVMAIHEKDADTGEVTFEMRGDANAVEDPAPYTVTEVRRVMFSVPGAARIVRWFGDPYVLGGLTLGAAALVIWAFWPRENDPEEPSDGPDLGSSAQEPTIRHAPGAALLAALLLTAPGLDGSESVLIEGEHLRMQVSGTSAQSENLSPGEPVDWMVGVWAEAPEPGTVRLELSGRGELAEIPGALLVSVQGCAQPWVRHLCPTGASELLDSVSLDQMAPAGSARHLVTMASSEQSWLRIRVSLADVAGAEGASGEVLIHAVGAGESLSASPGEAPSIGTVPGESGEHGAGAARGAADALARTGPYAVGAGLGAALVSVVLGMVLRRRARALQR